MIEACRNRDIILGSKIPSQVPKTGGSSMAKLSRVHGGQITKTPAELHAPRGADEPLRGRAGRERGRCGFWPAMGLALLAFAGAGARAQGTPAAPIGDIYDSGGGGPVYSDTYESDCESSNNTNVWKGLNPLLYRGEVGSLDSTGKCGPDTGPLKFWKQVGTQCLYTFLLIPPVTNAIIVPFDDLGPAENQGFKCGGDFTDQCMVICTGNGKFKPPPGTTLQPTQPPAMPQQPTQPKQPAQPPLMRKTPLEGIWGPFECPKPNLNGPKFTPDQVSLLGRDVASAKAMVAKAKTYTDKNPWDAGTQKISKKYYGNATLATQKLIRQDVNNVLKLLNGMNSVTSSVFPTGADFFGPSKEKDCEAYVRKETGTEIYLCDPFWKEPETGADSQPSVLVHELSHLPQGAYTLDIAYGKFDCRSLVYLTTTPAGQKIAPTYKMPSTGKPPANPLQNADSFMYFVYDVANQN
jgi:hypothetical protein